MVNGTILAPEEGTIPIPGFVWGDSTLVFRQNAAPNSIYWYTYDAINDRYENWDSMPVDCGDEDRDTWSVGVSGGSINYVCALVTNSCS